jgi:uncharacterized protein
MAEFKYTNALINETSPYLLQHAHNPVQWYPWSEEALSKAKKEDKPILLSVGYSACHWCHVMEHESFEDEETAKLMNESFICIKVDREERPDIDAIYMTAVQLLTGRGGWPMTVFLTPDQIPFFCGTYFPPEARYGMPGFRNVLLSMAQAYRDQRKALFDDAGAILAELRKSNYFSASRSELDVSMLERASSALIADYDSRNGGFGQAPKFPPSMALSFLMRSYRRENGIQFLEAVEQTLNKMACGGIYDQLGGGFHRYSVDARWLVPHFEKMLYDNALLSRVYLDAFLLTGNDFYRTISRETLDYILREMTSPEGGFYSSQDADSEGKEGAFFLWTVHEIRTILGHEEAELFCRCYGATEEGNFEGKNILFVPRSFDIVARLNNVPEARLREILLESRRALFEAREKRIKPERDEKILTAWNALMLRSFAEAANALDNDNYRQMAIRNADFLLSKLHSDGRLLRSYKNGKARFNAYLEDYACLVDGLISLYEAVFDLRWIRVAEQLAESMILKFWDEQGKGFYFTSNDHESLIHRTKDYYDSATPSGNSVAAYALLRLWKLTRDNRWSEYASAILESMAGAMVPHPSAFSHLLCSLDFCLGPTKEIAIVGDPRDEKTRDLLQTVFRKYQPNKVVACGINGGIRLLEDKIRIGELATAYVCENFTCGLPVTSPEALKEMLLKK